MPETRHQLLQHLAAYVLGRVREMVPGRVSITIILHDQDVDEWTVSTTLREHTLDRFMAALREERKAAQPTAAAQGRPYIRCLLCRVTSYHPKDIEQRFCGNCDTWHDQDAMPPTYEIGP